MMVWAAVTRAGPSRPVMATGVAARGTGVFLMIAGLRNAEFAELTRARITKAVRIFVGGEN